MMDYERSCCERSTSLSHYDGDASYPPEKIVPGTFHKTLTNLLVIINLAVSMDENR
jgi:hypothetical protein